jgi:serine/threonine protein kinase
MSKSAITSFTFPSPPVILGKGSLGEVYLVTENETKKQYAMKIIKKSTLRGQSEMEHLEREIKVHKKISHPNIIKLVNFFEDEEKVYMVLEYAPRNTLWNLLKKKGRLSEINAFTFFLQTCLAIDCLHKNGVLHRDIKV